MEGCATKQNEELRGNRDTNTIQTHHMGLKHKPKPRRSSVGPSGQVSSQEVITSTRWRDEDNVPTKTERPPSKLQKQGVRSNRKRGRQGNATYVYRWMLQELLHGQPVRHVNRVLEEREGDCTSTQPQGTASVQGRKAQTYGPVRDKERSQPGRKDHQAYRNSKGSKQPKARKTGAKPPKSNAGCLRIRLS